MSTNSGFVAITEAQNNKVTSVNTAIGVLDAFISEFTSQDYTAGNVTLTAAQFQAAVLYRSTNLSVARTLTLPATVKHLFVVDNTAGTNTLSVIVGTTTIVLEAAATGLFYTDATANGLVQIGGASGSASYDVGFSFPGVPASSEVVFRFMAVRGVDFADDFAGAVGHILTNPAAIMSFDIAVDGTNIGNMDISTGGVFTFVTDGGALALLEGERFDVTGPAVAGTGSDITVTFEATET